MGTLKQIGRRCRFSALRTLEIIHRELRSVLRRRETWFHTHVTRGPEDCVDVSLPSTTRTSAASDTYTCAPGAP